MNSSGYEHQQQEQHGYDPSQTQTQTQPQTQTPSQPYNPHNQPQFQQHPNAIPIAPQHSHSAKPSQPHAPLPAPINPVAVAVVAGALAQLVGNLDGLPREPIGPSQYRGASSRGSRPFRAYGCGRFNHQRGRGRGRGGDGRQFSSHSSEATIANVADAPGADGATSEMQPSTVTGQSSLPNTAQVPYVPLQGPPCKLWCEICKAECNTPEMMEQHKNGKRHRKNLLVHEEVQRRKALNGQQSENIVTSQSNLTIQPEKAQESEKKDLPEENMGSKATTSNHNYETELQNNVEGVSEVQTEEPQEEPRDNSAILGHGFKRKIRGGRGGKYMRGDDGSRKSVEPPKPKQVTSFICELCNVKCDSQAVYNSHVTGKKHVSNFKRVHGYQPLNGEAGNQPLHPLDIYALSNANNFPVQQAVGVTQGINNPQNLLAQLLLTVLSNVQVPATTTPLSGPVCAQIQVPALMAGSSHEPLSQNLSQTQLSDSLAHFESENPAGETKDPVSSITLQLDETAGSSDNGNIETADGTAAKEEMVVKFSQDSSITTPAENPKPSFSK